MGHDSLDLSHLEFTIPASFVLADGLSFGGVSAGVLRRRLAGCQDQQRGQLEFHIAVHAILLFPQ
jgi:hypothetical protein